MRKIIIQIDLEILRLKNVKYLYEQGIKHTPDRSYKKYLTDKYQDVVDKIDALYSARLIMELWS